MPSDIADYAIPEKNSLDLINDFESRYAVDEWKIGDLHIWPVIRIALMTIWEEHLYCAQVSKDNNHRSILRRVISVGRRLLVAIDRKAWNIRLARNKPDSYDVGVWEYDLDSVCFSGQYYSLFAGALSDLSGQPYRVARVVHSIHNKVPVGDEVLDVTLDAVIASFLSKFAGVCISKQLVGFDLQAPNLWLIKNGLPGKEILNTKWLLSTYIYLYLLRNFYSKALKRFDFRVVLKVCWYGLDGMALAWASKGVGIKCYDLQHGIAGAGNHRAYVRWSKVPDCGYELIPDGFWCWSNADADAINEWVLLTDSNVKTFVGGNVWQQLWQKNRAPEWILREFDLSFIDKGKPVVLFSLQGDYIPDILFELLRVTPQYNWLIRCHPAQSRHLDRFVQELLPYSYAEITKSTALPLPLLLSHIDVHMTQWSAVALDALEWGVPTILTHQAGYIAFDRYVNEREMFYSEDSPTIVGMIKRVLLNKKLPGTDCGNSSLSDLIVALR